MARTLRILILNPTAHNSIFCELRKLPSCPLSGGAMSKPQPQDGTEEEVRHIQKLKESLFSRNQTFASLKEFYTRIKILKKINKQGLLMFAGETEKLFPQEKSFLY